jgi:hypothetical protein
LLSEEARKRPASHPVWQGGALAGRRLLVIGEQGLGDEIMFASCVPDLLARGADCAIECSAKLEGLFRRSFPDAVVYTGRPDKSIPQHLSESGIDCEIPLGSLPRHFRRSHEDFPGHRGYLVADPSRIARWRAELAALGDGLKVGISWQGGSHLSRRPVRSLALAQWLPVLRTSGVHFVDLQYTDSAADIAELERSSGVRIHHWQAVCDDYEDTAAMVCALDLVISVCTAVIHLGGALGRPVWVLAPYSPEWRYGIAGETMPWYPSVRIIRQREYGVWEPVVTEAARRLAALAQRSADGCNFLKDESRHELQPGESEQRIS